MIGKLALILLSAVMLFQALISLTSHWLYMRKRRR